MIVKLWPVRGSSGARSCIDYVRDDNKVMSITIDANGNEIRTTRNTVADMPPVSAENEILDDVNDLENVIAYVSNSEKTEDEGRCYVSGYQCHPNHVIDQFACTREALGVLETKSNDVTCYHMVQSFPKGLEVSPELAHQCGLELLAKLHDHQGIVCTHIHPVVDEQGELHGSQIHNHIVFNAYKQPDCVDPEYPNQIKFNRCNAIYDQLQAWNDEIALDHGLPILSEINASKIYDWEQGDNNKTNKWRDRIRYDIRETRHKSKDWDDFKARMTKLGYQIREGDTVTYHAPDGKHRARAGTLGQEYTKSSLMMFFALRLQQRKAMAQAMKDGKASPIRQVYDAATGPLYAELSLPGQEKTYRLPIEPMNRSTDALNSYFSEGQLYTVTDQTGAKVYIATGDELKALLLELELEKDNRRDREEDIKRRKKAIEREQAAVMAEYRKDAGVTHGSYSALLYNENGTRKNNLELAFVLGSMLVGKYLGAENKYAKEAQAIADRKDARALRQSRPDRKMQMMMDGLNTVKQNGYQTKEELNIAVAEAGKAYNYAKKAYTNTVHRIADLEPLMQAIADYEDTADLVAMIRDMPDGAEKEQLIEKNTDLLQQHDEARRTMHLFKTTVPSRIADTKKRYERMKADLPILEEKFDAAKENMRTMKRTQYAYQLSQSAEWLAGKEANEKTAEKEQANITKDKKPGAAARRTQEQER